MLFYMENITEETNYAITQEDPYNGGPLQIQ